MTNKTIKMICRHGFYVPVLLLLGLKTYCARRRVVCVLLLCVECFCGAVRVQSMYVVPSCMCVCVLFWWATLAKEHRVHARVVDCDKVGALCSIRW